MFASTSQPQGEAHVPSTRSELVRRIARSLGLRAFRGHWNLRELLDDCESSAFELDLRAGPHVKPGAIAFLAVKSRQDRSPVQGERPFPHHQQVRQTV